MKINKTSLLLLVIGIMVITLANLSATHSQKVHGQNQLTDELSLAQQRLSKLDIDQLRFQQAGLQEQLSQTKSQLEENRNRLSKPTTGMDATDDLFRLAQSANVQITAIGSSVLSPGDLEGVSSSILPLSVRVEGEHSALMTFIFDLNHNFATGAVRSVEVNFAKVGPSWAFIQLAIYTYKGDKA